MIFSGPPSRHIASVSKREQSWAVSMQDLQKSLRDLKKNLEDLKKSFRNHN